ncbi:MAG TPA: HAMP domain-containing histidine kinase, partial [Bacteroidetes bacterium]|nr:HAMP domain-containing histidine kinase [Bacteroidota bacterium]
MKAGQRLAGGDTNGDAKTNTGRIMSVKKLGEAELEQLRLQLEELFRNYDVSLDLIPKATMPDELIDRILDEYIGRFEEIPGQDVLSLHQGDGELTAREKLKGLLMFSSQAVLLHENARVYQELADANRRLSEMAEKLRRKNEELEKLNSQYLSMLGFVSHELRSPLVSILGFAELLDDGVLGELTKEQRDAVAIISKVSRNLIDMIKNYLDLARIENGRLPLNRTRLDVESEVVQPLVREMAEQLAARNMKIQPARPEVDRTLDLWADPELL